MIGVTVGSHAHAVIVAGDIRTGRRDSLLQIAGQPFYLFADGHIALDWRILPAGMAMKHRQPFSGGADGITVLLPACSFAG